MKAVERWWSERLHGHLGLARWGTFGTPVLVFPTAGGDAEEVERQGLVEACADLLSAGRVKLYSCDSVAGHAMVTKEGAPEHRLWLLNTFHQAVYREVVPAIRADSGGHELPVVAAGASIGAFNALAVLCRYPDVFTTAVCLSGTFDLQPLYGGAFNDDLYFSSPLHFLPSLEGGQLDTLRDRFAVLASGAGDWEDPRESWRVAEVLGAKGIPNRVDDWGPDWPHEWPTWRRMLPQYLDEFA
jgi:esterase/lipase superfamily enzyme